ncbi:MAG: hypothetical protein HQK83_11800 [Fibrobacteria bacterium]|nr:hypothetical protein [Fibrobacteria bacterium]
MGKRHDAIGIKQTIHFEWLQKVANLMLAGLDTNTIRQEIHSFLKEAEPERSEGARSFSISNLMNIWVTPEKEIIDFRDNALILLQKYPSMALPIHWGMISVAYPFWYNISRQTGRLLSLQDQVTQLQIVNRLKEQYGDRQTVSRNAQFVIRSFIAWGVLKESEAQGCYQKAEPTNVTDIELTVFILESVLHATAEGKCALGTFQNNPAFFPFQFPVITGDYVSQHSERIDVVRYGLDDELLKLKNDCN